MAGCGALLLRSLWETDRLDPNWTKSNSTPSATYNNTILYTGRELDIATGLYYYRARYYDAALERFVSRDPAQADINLYRYCSNGPTDGADPSGDDEILEHQLQSIANDLATMRSYQAGTSQAQAYSAKYYNAAAQTAKKMYERISLGGWWMGEKLASALMDNWLKGAPKDPYRIDDCAHRAINNKTGPYQSLEARLTEWARKQSATSGKFDTGMLSALDNAPWIYVYATRGEFYHSLGGFEVKFEGTWERSGDIVRFTGLWSLQDRYCWKPGLTANVDGSVVPDDYALMVEAKYGARPFNVVGSWTGTIEFDLANPAPLPYPGFDPMKPNPGSAAAPPTSSSASNPSPSPTPRPWYRPW